ncbi:MAG: hypothetical protein ACQES0_05890 [Bacteroidota bacterium]
MKKIVLISLIMMLGTFAAKAQYSHAIGVRGSLYSGITYKKSAGDNYLEFIGSTRWGGFNFTALWEKNNPLADVENLYWYYGFGGHVGIWDSGEAAWFNDAHGDVVVIGVDGILGIEYAFDEIPFCISLDYKPAFNLVGYTGFLGDNGALSVRYTF